MKTKIEWTDAVWNPVTGCDKVSAGCKNCYAERVASRFWKGRKFTDVRMHHDRLDQPLHWKKPRRIFVNSMSDLFHDSVSDEYIEKVFAVMSLCWPHTFQILTKRPARMNKFLKSVNLEQLDYRAGNMIEDPDQWEMPEWPLKNVWLGVSVEDQKTADERIPLLLQTPAAVRFASAEPLLGPIDLAKIKIGTQYPNGGDHPEPYCINSFESKMHFMGDGDFEFEKLDWVICGGESGPAARPMNPDWVRSLRDQCQAADVPFFFKQWGEWAPYDRGRNGEGLKHQDTPLSKFGKNLSGRILDGRTWEEFPE